MQRFLERKKIRLPRSSYHAGHAFFLTIKAYRQYPWFRLYPELADSNVELLRDLGKKRGTRLYAWCIMPDHVHLLLQDRDVIDFVRFLKGQMTPEAFIKEPGRRLWQRSFYDHALRKEESISQVALYIWENPLRAGLVENPTEYL